LKSIINEPTGHCKRNWPSFDFVATHKLFNLFTPHPEQCVRFDSILRLVEAPRGVAGRNSDNTFIRKVLGWEPDTPLDKGLAVTCQWIKKQYHNRNKGRRVVESLPARRPYLSPVTCYLLLVTSILPTPRARTPRIFR
jgi:hypothetical protein